MTTPTDEDLSKLETFFVNIQAKAFSQAISFSNVVIGAGYAGALALWSVVKGQLDPTASNWVVISLALSMITFIAWNVFQMIWFATERLAYHTHLKGQSGTALIDKYNQVEQATQRRLFKYYLPIWVHVVVVCIVTAVIGIGVLLVNCAQTVLTDSAASPAPGFLSKGLGLAGAVLSLGGTVILYFVVKKDFHGGAFSSEESVAFDAAVRMHNKRVAKIRPIGFGLIVIAAAIQLVVVSMR